ncbi:vegetative cell wall protein gp1-like [Mauremys reevesii]|uniref:vegetative cell wall protein gp1-like n=1 Tax=Mauremys reevesii TaxID=260615 RepID=UPI00193FE821|nr:vegetative cell wall protein gp1-like [Mauremys reevesii]
MGRLRDPPMSCDPGMKTGEELAEQRPAQLVPERMFHQGRAKRQRQRALLGHPPGQPGGLLQGRLPPAPSPEAHPQDGGEPELLPPLRLLRIELLPRTSLPLLPSLRVPCWPRPFCALPAWIPPSPSLPTRLPASPLPSRGRPQWPAGEAAQLALAQTPLPSPPAGSSVPVACASPASREPCATRDCLSKEIVGCFSSSALEQPLNSSAGSAFGSLGPGEPPLLKRVEVEK